MLSTLHLFFVLNTNKHFPLHYTYGQNMNCFTLRNNILKGNINIPGHVHCVCEFPFRMLSVLPLFRGKNCPRKIFIKQKGKIILFGAIKSIAFTWYAAFNLVARFPTTGNHNLKIKRPFCPAHTPHVYVYRLFSLCFLHGTGPRTELKLHYLL